ncbi:MAG: signal recognition particle protein [Acidobacteria bacterium]|nr:signal recognition particle protein [Acidobacteriota bacterium]
MLENLSTKLQKVLKDLKGEGRISEQHIDESMREIRVALLEADVNFKVVKDFISRVREKALGQEVLRSLTPGQHLVKIVRDELVELLGGSSQGLHFAMLPPTVILMVGLQGSGKTTTTGKLALWLRSKGRRPAMVSTDVYRPAAIEQLSVIGRALDLPVFEDVSAKTALERAQRSLNYARNTGFDVLLVDTAGRLHIDEELMLELEQMKSLLQPREILLVADAMTGQDAVNSAADFNRRLDLSGVILTKMDGDARGGAALSIKAITGKSIKFIGVGEKYDAIEPFHPDRMAGRILGMGDVLSLIEKAEAAVDEKQARELLEKMRKDEFTLEDFRDQLRQIRKLGPLENLLSMIPGMGQLKNVAIDEKELNHIEAIINSMTPGERLNHRLINGSRRKRIARGSGRPVSEVNRLLKQYMQARDMMKSASKRFLGKRLPR